MKGFTHRRLVTDAEGDPGCRHDWKSDPLRCSRCAATRRQQKTWTAQWEAKDPATGGRRHFSKGGFRTRKAAQAHLNVVVGEVEAGTYRPDQPIDVATLMTQWLDAKRVKGLRANTIAIYQGVTDWYIAPLLGGRKVAALTPGDISTLVDHIRTAKSSTGRAGLSERTAQVAVSKLKAASAWATKNGMLSRDPLLGVDLPRVEHREMKAWSEKEVQKFLAYVRGDALEAAWSLFVSRGLRRGEVCGLRWDQVDFSKNTVRITRTRVSVGGQAQDSLPKSKASVRTVPIDAEVIRLLIDRHAAQKDDELRAGEAWEGQGHVFTDALGRPWHPDHLGDRFDKLCTQAKVRRIRLHDLRHTAASLMVARGVPLATAAALLGHASAATTADLYLHDLPGAGDAALAAMGAAFFANELQTNDEGR